MSNSSTKKSVFDRIGSTGSNSSGTTNLINKSVIKQKKTNKYLFHSFNRRMVFARIFSKLELVR